MQNQLEPVHTPQRTVHLYHCDHRGLPLALISADGKTDWSAEYDARGNVLSENNPHSLEQHLRLPGQQYDEETGLHYNRHRYYDPHQGRYITQDPAGLRGGWNAYVYPLDPVMGVDPYGLKAHQYSLSMDKAAENMLMGINGTSICESSEYAGLICAKGLAMIYFTMQVFLIKVIKIHHGLLEARVITVIKSWHGIIRMVHLTPHMGLVMKRFQMTIF